MANNLWERGRGGSTGGDACATAPCPLAQTVYSFPSGNLVDFTNYSYDGIITNGPEVVYNSGGVSITLTVYPTTTLYGGNAFLGGGYWDPQDPVSLDGNGYWGTNGTNDPIRYAATMGNVPPSSGIGALIFTFNTPQKAVGAYINYWIQAGSVASGVDVTIAALDQSGKILESYDISANYPINTPGAIDQGAFRGIFRSQGDIYGFELANSYDPVTDLSFDPVPLPPSVWLLGSGLLAL